MQVFPHSREAFEDLQRQSESERYSLSVVEEVGLLDIVKNAIANSKKVLWVVNTVSRCQERARDLKAHLADSGEVFCYHSRFKLCDRRCHHNRVVQDFDKGTVVVATQVCEMSLDLDADVLITEIAPVPSIIQRMGRCCREPVPKNGRIGKVYVYLPSGVKPYDEKEIEAGKIFVETLSAGKKQLCPSWKVVTQDFWTWDLTQWLRTSRFAKVTISSLIACLILTLGSICSNVQLVNQRPMATSFQCRGVSPEKMQNWADIFAKRP